ncbi:MAG: hypothetical protein FWE25_01600 [Lachnospiraceae bacterium]|nr:hypothetical protein [Lachnospiraceae bacterium]
MKRKQLVKKKRHRQIRKRLFGFMLVLLIVMGGIQTIASGSLISNDLELEIGIQVDLEQEDLDLKQEDLDLKQEDLEQIEADEVDLEPAYVPIAPHMATTVMNATQFRDAINDENITVINLGANFTVNYAGTVANPIPILNRSVQINGNGSVITVEGTNSLVTLGAVPLPATATLTLNNVRFNRTAAGVAYVFAGSETDTANWNIVLESNVLMGSGVMTTGTLRRTALTHGWTYEMIWRTGTNTNANELNRNGLVNAPNARLIVTGTGNHLGMRGTNGNANRHHLWVRHFEMMPGSSLSTTAANDVASSIRIDNNGTVDIRENATLNIWNTGSRAVTPSVTGSRTAWAPATSPAQSSGLIGTISRTTLHAGANVNIEASYHGFVSTAVGINANSPRFEMVDGAVMNLITNHARGVGFVVAPSLFPDTNYNPGGQTGYYRAQVSQNVSLTGQGTQLNIFSNNNSEQNGGSGFTIVGDNSLVTVEGGAVMRVYSARTTAVVNHGLGSIFRVGTGGTVFAIARNSARDFEAVFRFRQVGGMTFDINGGDVYIVAGPGQQSQGLRLYGGNNAVYVSNMGSLNVRHYGTGANYDATNPRGVALYYENGNINLDMADRFYLTDRYSQVDLFSQNGMGLSGASNAGAFTRITANPETIFTVSGNRSAATQSVFRGARLHFEMHRPMYFDFRNRGGGRVFTGTQATSQWIGADTDVAVWDRAPATFANAPVEAWSRINFNVGGVNLAGDITSIVAPGAVAGTVNSTDTPSFQARHNLMSPNYGRISANNATPRVDWLRIPTNADMRVFGHVSVQEGRPIHARSAWENEVWVEVVFRNPAGVEVYRAEGMTANRLMFDEMARDGLFEVVFAPGGTPQLLPEGYTVEVVHARRWSGGRTPYNLLNYHPARIPQDIHSNVERSRDVMPPRYVELPPSLDVIAPGSANITGVTDPYSVIRVSVNNAWIMDGGAPLTVQADSTGAFTFPLTGVTLIHGQQVRIHASDERARNIQRPQAPFVPSNPHDLYDIINSPILTGSPNLMGTGIPRTAGTPTLNGQVVNGNIQWIDDTPFHDAILPRAVMRMVEYAGSITLSVPDVIDFGTMTIGPGARFGDRLPHDPILVTDSRLVRDAWRVEAILVDEPLTNVVMNHTLPNGLVRRHGDGAGGFMSSVITPHTAVVFHSHTPPLTTPPPGAILGTEIENISVFWNNTNNGLMVETFGEMVRVGTYTAVIEWSLMVGGAP